MNVVDSIHNALVYDFGSSTVRVGYAGDAFPLLTVPSSYVQRSIEGDTNIQFGDEWFEKKVPGIEINQMVYDNGMITDSDILDTFFDWVLSLFEIEQPCNHPILFTQPTALTKLTGSGEGLRKWRTKLAQRIFEFADHPDLCLQHDSTLSCYAHGIHTGVVVDYGWSCVRAIPVVEGHPLMNCVNIHPIGGCELTNILNIKMNESDKRVRTFLDPRPSDIGLFGTTTTFTPSTSQLNYCVRHELNNIIQQHLRYTDVPPKANDEDIGDYIYYMPGRVPVEVKDEMIFMSKLLWERRDDIPLSATPLQEVVANAIRSAPKEYQPTLWRNIITSGGLSKVQGFNAMLEKKVAPLADPGCKVHVIRPLSETASGSMCTWTGGSIVASLPTFIDELCITREEWTETGENILLRKCL